MVHGCGQGTAQAMWRCGMPPPSLQHPLLIRHRQERRQGQQQGLAPRCIGCCTGGQPWRQSSAWRCCTVPASRCCWLAARMPPSACGRTRSAASDAACGCQSQLASASHKTEHSSQHTSACTDACACGARPCSCGPCLCACLSVHTSGVHNQATCGTRQPGGLLADLHRCPLLLPGPLAGGPCRGVWAAQLGPREPRHMAGPWRRCGAAAAARRRRRRPDAPRNHRPHAAAEQLGRAQRRLVRAPRG